MMDGDCLSTMSRPQLHQCNKVILEWEDERFNSSVLLCAGPGSFFPPLPLMCSPPTPPHSRRDPLTFQSEKNSRHFCVKGAK